MTQFDRAAVVAWLQLLHGGGQGYLHVGGVRPDGGGWVGRSDFTAGTLDQAADYAAQLDASGFRGIYVRMTSLYTVPPLGKRGAAADSLELPALWADVDIAGPGHRTTEPLPPDADAAMRVVEVSGLPVPTLYVHSGGGLYPIWLLTKPHVIGDAHQQVSALSQGWQDALGGAAASLGLHYGTGVGDLARVLRIPGTVNRKADLARPCRVLEQAGGGATYTLDELAAALQAVQPRFTSPGQAAPRQSAEGESLRPGDVFNLQADWADILGLHGWEHVRTDAQGVRYWTRPGKDRRDGISASTGRDGEGATDRLFVFSDATEFTPNKPYTKFAAYAVLWHGGDRSEHLSAAARELAARGYGAPRQQAGSSPVGDDHVPPAGDAPGGGLFLPDGSLKVNNPSVMADFLRGHLGTGPLAGVLARSGELVWTPAEGEDGYVPPPDGDNDGPAQVRRLDASRLAAMCQYTFRCVKVRRNGRTGAETAEPALFPWAAAQIAVHAPDMLPNVRRLRGVVHAPVLRPDGSILERPGYDQATGLLYLPEPGLVVPPVPATPTELQIRAARGLIDKLLADFQFASPGDRANWIGLVLTPTLRTLVPPPYKLGAITAPMPGSGKTLLANVIRTIHGGVFRAEVPEDEPEMRKQVTTILDVTTGPVVHFDNATGVLRSSTLAALLTSSVWDDRMLGSNKLVKAVNDRLWIITGNNLTIGGDLVRRTLWSTVDPGVPDPHLRTGFGIVDLEGWVQAHRGQLIHALLTLCRAWLAAGAPEVRDTRSDSYRRWVSTIGGLFEVAGIPGGFDHPGTARQGVGADDSEWADFLRAVHDCFSGELWTVAELVARLQRPVEIFAPQALPAGGGGPRISADLLPAELADKYDRHQSIGRSLGRWLANREGRWAGGYVVRRDGTRHNTATWRVLVHEQVSTSGGEAA